MTTISKCQVTLGLGFSPVKFGIHRPYETGNNCVCNISSNSNSNSNAEVYKWPLDYHYQIVTVEIIRGKSNEPIDLGSIFGWVLSGNFRYVACPFEHLNTHVSY